jgi:hypothetical protein
MTVHDRVAAALNRIASATGVRRVREREAVWAEGTGGVSAPTTATLQRVASRLEDVAAEVEAGLD